MRMRRRRRRRRRGRKRRRERRRRRRKRRRSRRRRRRKRKRTKICSRETIGGIDMACTVMGLHGRKGGCIEGRKRRGGGHFPWWNLEFSRCTIDLY